MPALFGGNGHTIVSVRYSYAAGAGEYLGGDSKAWSYLAFSLGFGWEDY